MKKILVLQTWGIGDMIMATPMLSALRKQFPSAKITVIAGHVAAAQAVPTSIVDEVRLIVPGKTIPGNIPPRHWLRAVAGFRRDRFDTAIICTRLPTRIALLLRFLAGIKVVAGDSVPPKRVGVTHWCPVKPESHRVLSNMNILRTLIPDAEPGPLSFPIGAASYAHAERYWMEAGLQDRPVLGIHPGSDPHEGKDKRPHPETLIAIIQSFLNDFPESRVALLFGFLDSHLIPMFDGIDKRVTCVRDLPLCVVGGLISKLRVMLAGDTALGHIAAALGIPTITLAGPTMVSSTRPWGNKNVIVKTSEELPCMPCYGTRLYGHCPYDSRCIRGISVSEVLEKVAERFHGDGNGRRGDRPVRGFSSVGQER